MKAFFLETLLPKKRTKYLTKFCPSNMLQHIAEFCQIFRSFFGRWSFKKICFRDLLIFRSYRSVGNYKSVGISNKCTQYFVLKNCSQFNYFHKNKVKLFRYNAGSITFTIIDEVISLILTRSNPNNTGP